MAITATSTLYDVQAVAPIGSVDELVQHFSYLQASDTEVTGTATVCKLPKGKIKIDFAKSTIIPQDAGASATLSVGFAAYQDPATRQTVNADPNAFLDAYPIDDSPARTTFAAPASEDEQHTFNTAAGLDITITVADGDMDQNDVLTGWIAYRFQS